MFLVMPKREAEDKSKAAIMQYENTRAHECHVERSREDQACRDQETSCAYRQRMYLEFAKLPHSISQPFSPTAAASGLIQMAIAPEAPTRMTSGATNEPQSIASTRRTSATEPLLLDAIPTRLAIMEAPREIGHAVELANAGKKLDTWRTTVSMMESRVVKLEESSNSCEVKTPADTRMTVMRSKIS